MNAIKNYFQNSVKEFNSVTWPTQKQAIKISVIVLVFMFASAIVLGIVDFGLTEAYQYLVNLNFL